jgi:hypothetical protein
MKFDETTGWMEVHTGRAIYPNLGQNDIDIEDIAHALSLLCRFNGHCLRFYSVAEHSCIIADYVYKKTGDRLHALAALLHDGAETYLADIPRPWKQYLEGYKDLEVHVEQQIVTRFKLSTQYPWSALIKECDQRIIQDERAALFDDSGHNWGFKVEPLGVKINEWSPMLAKGHFLMRFNAFSTEE